MYCTLCFDMFNNVPTFVWWSKTRDAAFAMRYYLLYAHNLDPVQFDVTVEWQPIQH